jgi:hypothetical protein
MSMQDLKIGVINSLAFSVTLTSIEQWLKITLLVVSIAYTLFKIIKMNTKNTED